MLVRVAPRPACGERVAEGRVRGIRATTQGQRNNLDMAQCPTARRFRPPDGADELRIRTDPDIRAALSYFRRLSGLLGETTQ